MVRDVQTSAAVVNDVEDTVNAIMHEFSDVIVDELPKNRR